MSPSDHLKAVKEKHGCFSCLKRAGRDHDVSNCSRRRQCSESFNGSQCKYFYHPLLHGANATNSAIALTVSSITGSKQAIFPVILVEILGSKNVKKQGNLLLDSGAQVSLIKLSVADELGLKGKEVTITIAKVGRGGRRIDNEAIPCSYPITSEPKCYPYSYSGGHPVYKQ